MRRKWLPAAAPAGALLVGAIMGTIHGVEAQSATAIAIGATSGPEESMMRRALSEELGNLRRLRVTSERRARWVLRGSVTRLDVQQDGDRNQIDCEVSLVVAERGNVRMMLSGRAAARGAHVDRLRDSAIRAAVRGALRPLEQNLR
ncbi:MAG: hypothetical protein AAGE52_15375 [Myxococcota bacterium]